MNTHEICPTCQPKHVLQPHEKLCNHGPQCARVTGARVDALDRVGLAVGDRRFDSNDEQSRADMLAELATLEPQFRADGKSDEYVRARFDHAREHQPGTADAAAAAARHRNAEAWKPAEQRTDAASKTVDPDEAERRMKKRNADAWQKKSGVELLKQLEGDDTDENGIGAFGMRHTKA